MHIYTKEEKKAIWHDSQVKYAELSHYFACCDLPEYRKCKDCEYDFCPAWPEVSKKNK